MDRLQEIKDKINKIDNKFEKAQAWGSWMVSASHRRKVLVNEAEKLGLKIAHKYTTNAS